jgi:2-polyprenyl-6-methoxyphenol hydroxylase-like FAD-dependent oxidoreductase
VKVNRRRVAVIGGSIAGCAAALAARRAGADQVVIFERTSGRLEDRGVGLGINDDLYAEMAERGYLDPDTPCLQLTDRKWITRDGASYGGRVVGTQSFEFRAYNWGSVWRTLRDRVPAGVEYRAGCPVRSVADTGQGAVVTLADGTLERFDVVVGADGYRSVVRAAMFPETRPEYAGYLLWRGTLPATELPPREGLWDVNEAVAACFRGGHLMMYLIPGRSGGMELNWAVYSLPPAGPVLELEDPTSLPPGTVADHLIGHLMVLGENMPPHWGEILRRTPTEQVLVQPIYDLLAPALAAGNLVLVGDAGAVARPHTGGGVVKALQDAVTLESVLRDEADWSAALGTYDARRGTANKTLVSLGRALGEATVLRAPEWTDMDPAAFGAFWGQVIAQGRLGGSRLSD